MITGNTWKIAVLAFLSTFFYACTPTNQEPVKGLEAVAAEHLEPLLAEKKLAGAAVLVVKGEEVLLDKAWGYADLEWEVPMVTGANFEIGSVTKQFTAAAILKLAEEGKLSLADDMSKFFPDFDTRGYQVSVRQLLDHTSGIQGYTESPVFGELVTRKLPRDTLLTLMEAAGFQFAPGTAQIYNNTAYFMLGLIIEQLSGTTYENYLDSVFFKPLGMTNTYYCSESKIIPLKAHGYDGRPDGLIHKGYLDHTWPYAAGSLCSTTADLVKWSRALHRDGKVLSAESYQEMITPMPLSDGTPQDYALGLMVWNVDGVPVIEHGGGINGFLSDMKYLPEQDIVVVALLNTAAAPGPGALTRKLLLDLVTFDNFQPAALDLDPATLAGKYSGVARGGDIAIEVTPVGEKLVVGSGGPQRDTFSYAGNQTWVNPVQGSSDDKLTFTTAADGSTTASWASGAARNFFKKNQE
jgi:CubicO group peptidase (beta-lactamase class C family)